MLVIVDPAIFLLEGTGPLTLPVETLLAHRVDEVNRICRRLSGTIPNFDWYWGRLQRELIRPLLPRLRIPHCKAAFDNMRRFANQVELSPVKSAKLWGVRAHFDWQKLQGWLEPMERIISGCAVTDETKLIVRLIPSRNLIIHAAAACTLHEKTRWRMYVHARGYPPAQIDCVQRERNLDVPWTIRYDERLPSDFDGARYPFCPPQKWWKRDVQPQRTHASKPAWIDSRGNAWARPNTKNGYHWDVYLMAPRLVDQIGLSQLNIVQFGAPVEEGLCGHIHHVPSGKKARQRSDTGWTCSEEI